MRLWTQDLVKKYKQRTVVKGVSVDVNQGEIVGLLGPNGAGKTTTFYMVVGLIKPYSGKVFLDEQDISTQPMYKRAQMGIGYLAQDGRLRRTRHDLFRRARYTRSRSISFDATFLTATAETTVVRMVDLTVT